MDENRNGTFSSFSLVRFEKQQTCAFVPVFGLLATLM